MFLPTIKFFRALLSLVFICSVSNIAFAATSVDSYDFCVDSNVFAFNVVLTDEGAETEVIFRIGADDPVFSPPNERIAVNFDSINGSITRQAPVVQTFDAPDFDRWQDGPIADFEIINEGGRTWRIKGSVPHGSDPFQSGDTISGIGIRANTNVFLNDLPVSACISEDVSIEVPETSAPPVIDGSLTSGEWAGAERFDIENGFMLFTHDEDRLYILIDMLSDTGDDPFVLGGGDQFWLHFDVDEDGMPTAQTDLRYRLESGTGNLRYQFVSDSAFLGFDPLEDRTFSARGEGFGCFLEDGTLRFNFDLNGGFNIDCSEHRIWEVAIDLAEVELRVDKTARFGYLVGSGSPFQNENFPANLNDYNQYAELTLLGNTRVPTQFGTGSRPFFEVTQAIQTTDNDLELVAEKPTIVRIWEDSTSNIDGVIKAYTFGKRNSIDLPGSPLLDIATVNLDRTAPRNDSNTISVLPDEWTRAGTVQFKMVALENEDDFDIAGELAATIKFVPTETPVFWTMPVRNNNTTAGTSTLPTDNFITNSEATLLSMAPLGEIEFVRRPIFDVDDITTSSGLKEELRTYDQQAILAWTVGLLLTGDAPFALPDQITGFHATSLSTPTGSAFGSSDPLWCCGPGDGRITWVSPSTLRGLTTYAHELNHNLDTDPNGTWGRHSCGAGPDGSWPYGQTTSIADTSIQEDGVARNMNQFNAVPNTTLDLMVTCNSSSTTPRRWMSPYRWNAWLDLYRTDTVALQSFRTATLQSTNAVTTSATSDVTDTFYIRGRVYPDGTGELGEVIRQPGMPETSDAAADYTLRVLDCSGTTIGANGLSPSFVDVEGEAEAFVSFSFQLPAPETACSIELDQSGMVVASQDISANAPSIELLIPDGGEVWTGLETISWQASDLDEDSLTYTLLYSSDGGMTWQSIKTGIKSTQYQVDSTKLPGSDNARIRVLASDGGNTSQDDSDGPFTVEKKPPQPNIITPIDGGVYDVTKTLSLEGVGYNTFGERIDPKALVWSIDGEPVGMGDQLDVRLEEGEYMITLTAMGEEDLDASTSVYITMAALGAIEDDSDPINPSVDIVLANVFVSSDRLVCEMTVNSGEEGLDNRSRLGCLIDFNDAESEMIESCDANQDSMLVDFYQLGSNGMCPVSDLGLNYRHDTRGGECTGGPDVVCETHEYAADGSSDEMCDGDVGGQPAERCMVKLSSLLSTVASERDSQCADNNDDCFGEDPLSSTYGAYAYFEAQLRNNFDRAPDTDDDALPNSIDEVTLIQLSR